MEPNPDPKTYQIGLTSSGKKLKRYELEVEEISEWLTCIFYGDFPPDNNENLYSDSSDKYTVLEVEKVDDQKYQLILKKVLSPVQLRVAMDFQTEDVEQAQIEEKHNKTIIQLQGEINKLQQALKQESEASELAKSKLEQIENLNAKQNSEENSSQKRIRELEEKLVSYDKDIISTQKTNQELQSLCEKKLEEIGKLKSDQKEKQSSINELQKQLDSINQETEANTKETSDANTILSKELDQAKERQNELIAKIEQFETQLTQMQELEKSLEANSIELKNVQEENLSLIENIKKKENENLQLSDQLKEAETKKREHEVSVQKTTHKHSPKDLEDKLTWLHLKCERKDVEISQLKKEIEDLNQISDKDYRIRDMSDIEYDQEENEIDEEVYPWQLKRKRKRKLF